MGSVIIDGKLLLPTGLDHAGNIPAEAQVTKTDAAHAEFPQKSAGAPANRTAVVFQNLELWFGLRFQNQCFFSHSPLPVLI
jgi:hypothetical protein